MGYVIKYDISPQILQCFADFSRKCPPWILDRQLKRIFTCEEFCANLVHAAEARICEWRRFCDPERLAQSCLGIQTEFVRLKSQRLLVDGPAHEADLCGSRVIALRVSENESLREQLQPNTRDACLKSWTRRFHLARLQMLHWLWTKMSASRCGG